MRFPRFMAVALAVLLCGALVGDDPKPAPKVPDLPPLFRKLGLSDEQVKEVAKIRASYDAKVKDLEEKIRAAREEEQAEVEKLLTDTQRARLKELHKGGGAEDVFLISGPAFPGPVVKQGATASVALGLRRGRDFTDDVTLTFEDVPKGLKFEPATLVLKAGDTGKVEVKVVADRDTSVGDHFVTVRGTPPRGAAASLRVKIKVEPRTPLDSS